MRTFQSGVAAVGVLVVLLGCKLGGGGGSALEIGHADVSDKSMEIKSGHTYATTMTYSWPDGKGDFAKAAASSVTVYLSNQTLDPSSGMISMGKPPAEPGGVTVQFTLLGKDGTSGSTSDFAPEAGSYSAKGERFMKVESVAVHSQAAGKSVRFDRDKLDGNVEVTKSGDGKVEGTIDLTDGAGTIKGKFVATLGEGKASAKN